MNTSRQHPWEHLHIVMYTSTVIGHDIIVHRGTDNVTYWYFLPEAAGRRKTLPWHIHALSSSSTAPKQPRYVIIKQLDISVETDDFDQFLKCKHFEVCAVNWVWFVLGSIRYDSKNSCNVLAVFKQNHKKPCYHWLQYNKPKVVEKWTVILHFKMSWCLYLLLTFKPYVLSV